MLKKLASSKTSIQTLLLFGAQLFGMIVGFISNMLLAKEMGVQVFGIYSFSLAIIFFLAIFFEFGYFASASRLLATNHDKAKEKELVGASFVIVFGISILFFITIFIVSQFVDSIFKDKVGETIRIASIVSWSFILPFFMDLILKGSNHIEYLAGFNFLWKLLFVVSLFSLYSQEALTPLNVLLCFSVTSIVSFFVFIVKLKPVFTNLKINVFKIHIENKVYGFHLYTGRVVDTASYQLDRLMIGFFIGAKDVGLYSLANSMATPINTFSNSLSSSKFKSFSDGLEISKKILRVNFLWIIIAVLGANSLGYFILNFYLSQEYQDVQLLLLFMSFAIAFQAAYQPYNAWLGTNGFGKFLKKKAIYTAIANIVLNFLLIPFFGAIGAVMASMLSMMYSFFLHLKYYKLGLSSENNIS